MFFSVHSRTRPIYWSVQGAVMEGVARKAHSKSSLGCGNSSICIDFLIWSGALLPMRPSTPNFFAENLRFWNRIFAPWDFLEIPEIPEIFCRSRRSLSRFEEIFKAWSRPRSRFINILQDFGRIFLPKSSQIFQNLSQKDSQRIQSRPAVKMLCFY